MYHVLEINHDIYIHKNSDANKTKCEISAPEMPEIPKNILI